MANNSSSGSTYVPLGSSDWPLFVYPQPGDPHVDITQPVQWTAANNARAYQLQIGTTLGGNDVFDSGVITATSVAMPPLPSGVVLYARVRAVPNGWGDDLPAGIWPHGSYASFRTDDQTPPSTFTNISADGTLPVGTPIEWNASPLAVGYRLTVDGIVNGAVAVDIGRIFDSGVIHTTHIFVNSPIDSQVSAALDTIYLDRTVTTRLTFTVAAGTPSFTEAYDFAKELTAEVRSMADSYDQPYDGTVLNTISNSAGLSSASCEQFMLALRQLLVEARVGLSARTLDIELQADGNDTHTLVEVLDDTTNRWTTLDPTFGLVTLRSDGSPATTAEISAAVRAQNWSALNFTFLTDAGEFYVHNYYVDYPLLYMNIQSPSGSGLVENAPTTLAPYFDTVSLPILDPQESYYSLKCVPGSDSATADINAVTQTLSCGGADEITGVFYVYTMQAASGASSTPTVWQLRRFIF